MGGFMLVEGKKPARTLTYEEFEALCESGKIEFPTISENEIQDRSKSDMISKGLVVIQTSWFILQTMARIIQHLSIAELELITLSFALLNGVMYFLWWHKPLNVRCPIMLYLNPAPHPSTERGRQLDPAQVLGAFPETRADLRALTSTRQSHLLSRFSSSSLSAYVAFMSTASGFIDLNPPVCSFADTFAQGVTWILFAIFMLLLAAPYASLLICKDFLDSLSEMSGVNDLSYQPVNVDALEEVSPFYAAALPTKHNRYTVYFSTAIAGLGFAGIHYFSWKLPFSSDGDRMLWMACIYFTIYCTLCYLSFALMFASGFLSLITYFGPSVDLWPTSSTSNLLQFCLAVLSWSVVLIAGVTYVPARSVLFITAFSMLRQLPENAYRTVPWTSLIPHMH